MPSCRYPHHLHSTVHRLHRQEIDQELPLRYNRRISPMTWIVLGAGSVSTNLPLHLHLECGPIQMNHRPFHSRSDCKVRVHFCSQSDESEPRPVHYNWRWELLPNSFRIWSAFQRVLPIHIVYSKIKILKFASLMLCIGGRGANPISLELKIEA